MRCWWTYGLDVLVVEAGPGTAAETTVTLVPVGASSTHVRPGVSAIAFPVASVNTVAAGG